MILEITKMYHLLSAGQGILRILSFQMSLMNKTNLTLILKARRHILPLKMFC